MYLVHILLLYDFLLTENILPNIGPICLSRYPRLIYLHSLCEATHWKVLHNFLFFFQVLSFFIDCMNVSVSVTISFRYVYKSFVTRHVVICRRKRRKLFILSEAHEGHLITGYFPGVWKYGQFTSGHIGYTKMPLLINYIILAVLISRRSRSIHVDINRLARRIPCNLRNWKVKLD
jgi:hypothetical protein